MGTFNSKKPRMLAAMHIVITAAVFAVAVDRSAEVALEFIADAAIEEVELCSD